MWSGVQESDTNIVETQESYRVWWKSQAIGCQGTAVNHTVDVKGWEAWRHTYTAANGNNWVILGAQDPPVAGPGPTIYRSGMWYRQQGYSSYPGPRNYYQPAPSCRNTPNWSWCYPDP
jgi:hypothetical protein